MMKIAIVITSLQAGGAEKIVLEIANKLKNDFKYKIFVIKKNYHSPCDELAGKYGLPVTYLNSHFRLFNIVLSIKLYRLLRDFRPQIIHTHLKAADYVLLYQVLNSFKTKWIHTVHTVPTVDCRFIRRIIYRPLYNKKLISLIAVSAAIKEKLQILYPGALTCVINNGINLNIYKRTQRIRNSPSIVHVGRFTTVKNHSFLLSEYKKVLRRFPDVTLTLIGAGRLRKTIIKDAKRNSLLQNITFIENTAEVEKHLNEADIFVLPSFYEGLPLALLEAMASGLIVIVAPWGSDIIQDGINGFITEIKTNHLAVIIENIIKNLDNLENIRRQAVITAKEYSLSKTAELYRNYYHGIKND